MIALVICREAEGFYYLLLTLTTVVPYTYTKPTSNHTVFKTQYYASFLFIHCFKEDFCAKSYIFGTEEVLIINVFPDSRTNRIRKTGCFHPGRILGPRGAELEGRSSQSPNSPLTPLLFIKDYWNEGRGKVSAYSLPLRC